MRVLVIGSGGREHALVWALKQTSQRPLELFCAPGNAGIAQIAECVAISANDVAALAEFARREQIDLTMVGPEAALAEGVVDEFERRGLRIVGPTQNAARLETSKAFAKDFMQRHRIPTARYRVAASVDDALECLQAGEFGEESAPVVVKADGLAAGKGVIVAASRAEAADAVRSVAALGSAAHTIILEEALLGREASVLLFSDGQNFRLMPAARDHKRIGDGDTGPNTGGMGAITNDGVIDANTLDRVISEIVEPTLRGARAEGIPFRGILFIGLMLTREGPKVLEYNVRFGDPETQAILVRLQSDLVEIFDAIVDQRLAEVAVHWSDDSSACVVLAARGYPAKAETGARIDGLDQATHRANIMIFHAATKRGASGEWLTSGGRVLGVTATGKDLEAALTRCYAATADIHWAGMQFRRDIGRASAPTAVATS
ncbi:MAG TPA: phosphoribosylamine--glycine ligase [Pyrinomonadaceae bacterium]|jgi:phosphoribosylamine--glycine ligase|nr:phosphoribosylamine--glycine ligase [Pyrinomonadaceae bacterium]